MNIFKQYWAYLKDNPQGYWFKRKMFGWGWVPVRWQGWATIAVFVAFLLFVVTSLPANPTNNDLIAFFTKILLGVAALLTVCSKTGEKPRWQWGPPRDSKGPS